MNTVCFALLASMIAIPALAQEPTLAPEDGTEIRRLVQAELGQRSRWVEVNELTPRTARNGKLEVVVGILSCLSSPLYAIATREDSGWVLRETGVIVDGVRQPDPPRTSSP